MSDPEIIEDIAARLLGAERVLFITGAGISADSGLPTYRGVGGLYEEAITDEGYAIEEALSGQMMAARPDITWKYLLQIERNCRGAEPNIAHEFIAELEQTVSEVIVFTQNVDGLHVAAGSSNVIEIHGNLHHLRCTACSFRNDVETYAGLDDPPLCPRCAHPIRPDVVLFGEPLPYRALAELEDAFDTPFDLVFSIGTSSLFPYIIEPVLWAHAEGTPTVEINPGETAVSHLVDFALKEGAASAMGRIREALQALRE